MVVGGGIAGMQAALDIGNAGHTVYLVERETTVGGHMLQFDKTFPTLDCAACIGTPKMVEVAQNANIRLLTYSDVTDVSGYIGNYQVTVTHKPRYIKEGVCTGCGECTTVCPVSLPSEWDEGLADRKAIYRAFPQAVPITFTIDKKDRAPCTTTCPAGINVQGYVQLIGQGKYREAVELILKRLPLPGVLGRVCPHPCESQCRRREVDARAGHPGPETLCRRSGQPPGPAHPGHPRPARKSGRGGLRPCRADRGLLSAAAGLPGHPFRGPARARRHAARRHPGLSAAPEHPGWGNRLTCCATASTPAPICAWARISIWRT